MKYFSDVQKKCRHKDQGEVIIDTNFGKHPIYSYVQKQDYELFADMELNLRKELNFPPFFFACRFKNGK